MEAITDILHLLLITGLTTPFIPIGTEQGKTDTSPK